MKNKEIRKIAKEKMKGKLGKAIGITLLYGIIMSMIAWILKIIPGVGNILSSIVSSVISVPLAFGWMKQLIELANGEEVGIVDFLKHGFDNFGKVWMSNLRIVLKCMVSILLIIVGAVLMGMLTNPLIGIVIMAGAAIWMVIVVLKYAMLNYTIAYDSEDLKAKELVEKAENDGKGKIGKFICMSIYYGLQVIAVYFIAVILASAISVLSNNLVVATLSIVLAYVISAVFALIYSIQNIFACNEFYKIRVLNKEEEVISTH